MLSVMKRRKPIPGERTWINVQCSSFTKSFPEIDFCGLLWRQRPYPIIIEFSYTECQPRWLLCNIKNSLSQKFIQPHKHKTTKKLKPTSKAYCQTSEGDEGSQSNDTEHSAYEPIPAIAWFYTPALQQCPPTYTRPAFPPIQTPTMFNIILVFGKLTMPPFHLT